MGDRVKVEPQGWIYSGVKTHTGVIVRVNRPDDGYSFGYQVQFDDNGAIYGANGRQITVIDVEANDPVNHPSHYTRFPVEVIEITEHLNFCVGNAVKYLCRAGFKDATKTVEDLEKAKWYIEREIERVKRED